MNPQEILEALAAPFDPSEVKFKPAVVNGNRALALAYVDARVIQDRLDDVVGIAGWQDDYAIDGVSVICTLKVKIGEEWIQKMDVGGESEQPDEGDRRKAAFSDALKRAAVKFGIGRYLYRLKSEWVGYDPKTRRFTETPRLPAPAKTPPRNGQHQATPPAKPKKVAPPTDTSELKARLEAKEQSLVAAGKCEPGTLWETVRVGVVAEGYPEDLAQWDAGAIEQAIACAKTVIAQIEARPASPPDQDTGELVTKKETGELAQLMKAAKKTWPQCVLALRLDKTAKPEDLTIAQYLVLKTKLEKEVSK